MGKWDGSLFPKLGKGGQSKTNEIIFLLNIEEKWEKKLSSFFFFSG